MPIPEEPRTKAGAAIGVALVDALFKERIFTEDQIVRIYQKALQYTGGLPDSEAVDECLADLIKMVTRQH